MSNIYIDNLIKLQDKPSAGQRVLQISPGVWIPVGLSGAPASSDSSSAIDLQAGVLVDDNGVLKVQLLHFEGTQPVSDSSSLEDFTMKIFNTGHPEPDYGGSGGGSLSDEDFFDWYTILTGGSI